VNPTVLLTGAAGNIGAALRQRLPAFGWTLRNVDLAEIPDGTVCDVTSAADLDRVVPGVDAIVHLAGIPHESPWPVVRKGNFDGVYEVFDAARRHGIERIVWASSNHAVGFAPVAGAELPADLPPRPDTLYGVSKAFGEALGRYFSDRYGLRIACLRIGTFADRPPDVRALSTWLSPDDCTRLVDACLRSDALRYAVVWGVSANTRRRWSLAAGRALGYEPQDDAEHYAAELADPQPRDSDRYVGGVFTTERYGIDEIRAGS
jgi:uronate dehydrogenase